MDEYVPVAERIAQLYERFPTGRIATRLIEHSPTLVIVQALVYRSAGDDQPSATGFAAERPGDGEINTHACLENTETSAIGRALANLGFLAKRTAPPARSPAPRAADHSKASDSPVSLESLGVRTINASPAVGQARVRPTLPGEPSSDNAHVEDRRTPASDLPSALARDLIRLLHDAERHGMRPRRVANWKSRVQTGFYRTEALQRLEGWLRMWIGEARERGGS